MKVYASRGWIGVRFRRPSEGRSGYVVGRDTRGHPLLFTERNGIGGRAILRLGPLASLAEAMTEHLLATGLLPRERA